MLKNHHGERFTNIQKSGGGVLLDICHICHYELLLTLLRTV